MEMNINYNDKQFHIKLKSIPGNMVEITIFIYIDSSLKCATWLGTIEKSRGEIEAVQIKSKYYNPPRSYDREKIEQAVRVYLDQFTNNKESINKILEIKYEQFKKEIEDFIEERKKSLRAVEELKYIYLHLFKT